MRKLVIILFLAIMLVGCSLANKSEKVGSVDKEKEQQAIAMQLLRADEGNGVTLENEMYQQLTGLVEANPDIGVADDFSIHPIDLVDTKAGESVLLFLGINRLEKPIKNIKFEYTSGVETEGSVDYVFDREEVDLSESFAGIIQPGHAIPFTIPVNEKGEALFQLMTEENKIVKLENATFELEE
ncbi:hypothetical protein [Bacillus sp. FSL K6-3431]|uniref:hypothetical protein n=1 Tax=Bacillus sp. FSL K6-3431 TaxID=2921500 RepID=UPI0030FB72D4